MENETLTFSELFTDKLRPLQVHRRKAAAERARELLNQGDAPGAVRLLEEAARTGDDRDVLALMGPAYRAEGNEAMAKAADMRSQEFLDSRLR